MRQGPWWIGLGLLATLLLVIAGCPDDDASDDDTGDDDSGDDDTGGDDDSGDDDSGDDDSGDDDSSQIEPCTPFNNGGDVVTIDGTVLTPDVEYLDGEVSFSRSSGLILCVGEDCSGTAGYADGVLLCSEGIVTPALIDAHNHMQYNTLPMWHPGERFSDRYDWQGHPQYYGGVYEVLDIQDDHECEIQKWAEARLMVAGTASVNGTTTYGETCLQGWVRDLDADEPFHGIPGYEVDYSAQKVEYLDAGDAADLLDEIASGQTAAFTPHVSEGWGDGVAWELQHLFDIGLVDPYVSIIHAMDNHTDQYVTMLENDMTILWAPRSNLELYWRTTPVHIAHNLGLRVALAPDWTASGSLNILDELSCAHRYDDGFMGDVFTPEEMLWMVTAGAARAVGAEDVLGTLEVGFRADIAVFAGDRLHPYEALMDLPTEAVRATFVDGQVVFGDEDLVSTIEPAWCETLDVCGVDKTICLKTEASSGDGHDQTLAELQAILEGALLAEMQGDGVDAGDDIAYLYDLYPLFECGAPSTRFDCDPMFGAQPGDADGDGVADGDDGCPAAFDPEQWDLDRDGAGDACDVCPMDPTDACGPYTPGDTDGDGTPDGSDLCPHVVDGGEDADGDGKGDLCDLCPTEANPGSAACTFDIPTLSNEAAPGHPFSGTPADVEGVVVTGIRPDVAFFVSDPAVGPFGGLYVYIDEPPTVQPGDVVDLTGGDYKEYYGLGELAFPTVTVTGTQAVPGPYVVDPADVATYGPLAEAYENQLITVQNVTVTSSNPDAPGDYEEFEVTGGLRVDDWLFDDLVYQPAVGTTYASLTGILVYSYGNHKLCPRDAGDVVE